MVTTWSLTWTTDPLALIVHVLAAFRLTRLHTRDSLPPLPRVRDALRERWDGSPLSELLDCPWCAGWWITLGVAVAASSPLAPVWWPLAVALAMAAVVALLFGLDGTERE